VKDPIGFDGGDANLYGYVLADPVNLVDAAGTKPGETVFSGGTAQQNWKAAALDAMLEAFNRTMADYDSRQAAKRKFGKDIDLHEYCGMICDCGGGSYMASAPWRGATNWCLPTKSPCPKGRAVDTYHSHWDGTGLSPQDKRRAKEKKQGSFLAIIDLVNAAWNWVYHPANGR
jgi:uncharacterized protein RhaS with RHS repeats